MQLMITNRTKSVVVMAGMLAVPMMWLYRSGEPTQPEIANMLWRDALESSTPGPLSQVTGPALEPRDGAHTAPETPEAPETITELRRSIAAILDEYDVPGVGIALVDARGHTWSGGVGLARRATPTPVDADTVFRVGSISKSTIALATLTLLEDERISLDTSVRALAPEIEMDNAWADTDPVTVAHLLEHTAGFDDMRFNEMFLAPEADDDHSPDHPLDHPLSDVLAQNPRSRTSRWRPGSRFAYSNPGYTVVAYLMEKLTHVPFERYVHERVLVPAGMASADFTLTPDMRARLAQGYTGRQHRRLVTYRRLWHRPAGELMATPRDMAAFVSLFLRRGQTDRGPLVTEGSLARMERGETRVFPRLATGYGLGNQGDTSLGALTRGHSGAVPGFYSEFRYAPDMGVGFALLYNSTGDDIQIAAWKVRHLVFDYLTRGMTLPEPPTAPVPAHELERHVGRYQLTSPRFQLLAFIDKVLLSARVSLEGDELFLELGNGARTALVPTGPDQFRVPGHSGPVLEFGRDANGERVMALADYHFAETDSWWAGIQGRVLGAAIWLVDIGFFWNIVWLPGWLLLVMRSRKLFRLPGDALPALACACFLVMQRSFAAGFASGALGQVSALSLTFLCTSVLLPIISVLAVVSALRGLRRHPLDDAIHDVLVERAGYLRGIYSDGWNGKLFQLAVALACVGLSVWLGYNGILGLRTWAW